MDYVEKIIAFAETDRIGRFITAALFAAIIIFLGYLWFRKYIFPSKPVEQAKTSAPVADFIVTKPEAITPSVTESVAEPPKKAPSNKPRMNNQEKKPEPQQPIISGKNVNTGTNNGIIGDNATVYTGKPKMHPDEKMLNDIEAALPDKGDKITLMALNTGAGSADYAAELLEKMKDRGYTNLGIGYGMFAPVPKKGVTLHRRKHPRNGEEIQLLINVD